MTTKFTGIIQEVRAGKPFVYKAGNLAGKQGVTDTIILDTDQGEIKIQRNRLSTSVLSLAPGTEVEINTEEFTRTTEKGTFTNKVVSKNGLIILENGNRMEPTATGGLKPAYVPGQTQNSTPSGSGNQSVKQFDSNGARCGMVVNNAVKLAEARKQLSLQGLKEAADDVLALTQYTEGGGGQIASPTSSDSVTEASKKTSKTTQQNLPKKEPVLVDEDDDFSMDD